MGKQGPLPPKDLASWRSSIGDQRIASQTLDSIGSDQAFSGSKIPFKSFLKLRAIWPDHLRPSDAKKTLQDAGFFSASHSKVAEELIPISGSCYRGLDKFHAFLRTIVKDEAVIPETPSPPRRYSGDKFGAFAVPLQLLGALVEKGQKAVRHEHDDSNNDNDNNDDCTPKIFSYKDAYQQVGEESGCENNTKEMRKLNFNPLRVPDTPQGQETIYQGLKGIRSQLDIGNLLVTDDIENVVSSNTSPSPSAEARRRRLEGSQRQSGGNFSQYSIANSIDGDWDRKDKLGAITAQDTSKTRLVQPPETPHPFLFLPPKVSSLQFQTRPSRFVQGRTRYEIQTSSFFFAFLAAIQAQVFPHFDTPRIMALPEERPYQFGQSPITAINVKADIATERNPKSFFYIAVPDGAFISQIGSKNEHSFAHFELKPFRRKGAKRTHIILEETAEMAAILYQELPVSGDCNQEAKKAQYRLLISLDCDEFWFVRARFTNNYLTYIGNGTEITAPRSLSEDDMIEFQQIGPFELENRSHMINFVQVLLSIIFKEMDDTKEFKDLKAEVQ